MKSVTHTLKFEYLDRGYNKTLVLLPGWATDARIFGPLDLKFNYIVPKGDFPYSFEESLLDFVKKRSLSKISMLGWSLGGFAAADFAAKQSHLIDELILISIREKYKKGDLQRIERSLKKSKGGFLYKFYRQCFYNKENIKKYKEIFKTFRDSFKLDYLLDTLNYLSKTSIPSQALKDLNKIKIIHGKYDEIAPIEEARGISEKLKAEFIEINNCGHLSFLEEDLSEI